jgi:glyoxylase-like metal-dependent hydrolase (beta-lactamase superfamily II)
MGDGDSEQWVKTLAAAKKLGAKAICPGHGPLGTVQILDDQQSFFVELRKHVKKYAGRKPEEIKAAVEDIRTALLKQKPIARYVGDSFTAQVEKVYVEMGGKPFQSRTAALDDHKHHAHDHGKELVKAR